MGTRGWKNLMTEHLRILKEKLSESPQETQR